MTTATRLTQAAAARSEVTFKLLNLNETQFSAAGRGVKLDGGKSE
jgi:hypothetical protein